MKDSITCNSTGEIEEKIKFNNTTMMTFKESIKTVYCKYATIKGRATRAEYWWFQLYYSLVIGGSIAIGLTFMFALDINIEDGIGGFVGIFIVANIIPLFCLTVRRLHDTGRSGSAICWNLIPSVGSLIFFFIMCAESDGDNEYGPVDGKEGNCNIKKTDIDL